MSKDIVLVCTCNELTIDEKYLVVESLESENEDVLFEHLNGYFMDRIRNKHFSRVFLDFLAKDMIDSDRGYVIKDFIITRTSNKQLGTFTKSYIFVEK